MNMIARTFSKLRLSALLLPTLILSSCTAAPAFAVDSIEVKLAETPPAACQFPNGQGMMMPMPCAFMFALMQKVMGGGCGERACPVRL